MQLPAQIPADMHHSQLSANAKLMNVNKSKHGIQIPDSSFHPNFNAKKAKVVSKFFETENVCENFTFFCMQYDLQYNEPNFSF